MKSRRLRDGDGADRIGKAPSVTGDNWDPAKEEAFALTLAPLLRGIFEDVKAKLPDGIDFGLLIVVPPPSDAPKQDGRVIALTTDPARIAVAAAQWSITRLRDP